MTFREEKARARQDLHETMAEPVFYFERRAAARKVVTVRLHLKFNALGDLRNGGFADWSEQTPKAIFLNAQIRPVRDAYLVTKDLGVFRIDSTDPKDDITRKATIVELDTAAARQLGWDTDKPWSGEKPPGLTERA